MSNRLLSGCRQLKHLVFSLDISSYFPHNKVIFFRYSWAFQVEDFCLGYNQLLENPERSRGKGGKDGNL